MKIGDKFWGFDGNRRVYPKEKTGFNGPIFVEHFYRIKITGETSRSWIFSFEGSTQEHFKAPKKGPHNRRMFFTDEEKSDKVWSHDNRQAIIRDVNRCDVATLRAIAVIVNYNPDLLQQTETEGEKT